MFHFQQRTFLPKYVLNRNVNAATKDAPTKSEVGEGSALGMGQSQQTKPAVMKDAVISLCREVSASGMEQRANYAVTWNTPTEL